jgi:hypothetical protein
MRFVILLEILATILLPGALIFIIYVFIYSLATLTPPLITFVVLAIMIGLPSVLIVVVARKPIYIMWLGIYLCAVPIWNFVLPLYAFWNMDNFVSHFTLTHLDLGRFYLYMLNSRLATRKVENEDPTQDHSFKSGEFDSSDINLKTWSVWMRERNKRSPSQKRSTRRAGGSQVQKIFINPLQIPTAITRQSSFSSDVDGGSSTAISGVSPPMSSRSSAVGFYQSFESRGSDQGARGSSVSPSSGGNGVRAQSLSYHPARLDEGLRD